MWQYNYGYSNELYHHGILGQRWGVRRYQNKDGTLTAAGKKRISKEYEKAAIKTTKRLNKNSTKMYIDSYNRAADYMNEKGINQFNNQQKKKYGDKYTERSEYESDYMDYFNKQLTKELNVTLHEFYKNDVDYKKSKELVDKYGMTQWDNLAKNNEAKIEELRKAVEKGM